MFVGARAKEERKCGRAGGGGRSRATGPELVQKRIAEKALTKTIEPAKSGYRKELVRED